MSTADDLPDDPDDLSEEEAAELSADVEARLDAALADEAGLSEDGQRAREALLDAGEASTDTATVTFPNGIEIDVRTTLPGRAERTLASLDDHDDADAALGDLLDVIMALVEGPDGFTERKAWADAYDEYGSAWLLDALERLLEPAEEELEAVRTFRPE